MRALDAPAIDGRAGDAVWRSAQRYHEFRQFEPRLDADPSFRTEFQVAHDDRNLYVYVRAYDPSPDSIMRALTRRDVRGPSDQIGIYIDSWLDGRTGYSFHVNPDGVRRDFAICNDNEQDASWNGVWDAATAVDSLGWTAEFGLTPNITLDATVNPDFGQVEADPAVLNLTAFETFLSERRPFFVEGTGFYRFALNCYIVVDCNTNEGLFYSRRIGRSPALRDDYGDASSPEATPIAAAAKVTGRTRHGLSFGLLDAVTPRVEGVAGRTIEPGANFAVLRAQQDLRGGQAGVSVIATAVNRGLDSWTSPALHDAAYAAGASFRNRLFGGQGSCARTRSCAGSTVPPRPSSSSGRTGAKLAPTASRSSPGTPTTASCSTSTPTTRS